MPDEATLSPGLEIYWEAFWQLHGDRPRIIMPIPLPLGGFVLRDKAGELPWTVIDRWCRRYGIAGTEFDLLYELVKRMDQEWLEIQAKRMEDEAVEPS